ncbi:hypothetical protein JNUCC0626_50305 (plasmid) [Lentzea sp. JNUCC 0626]|uniref:hypothetical protein n=1 Tax=Lentzea sp. JNUCC 0626 TaxID=3367513 RepID=UPI00374A8C31
MTMTSPARRWLADPTTRLFLPLTVLSVALPIIAFILWGTGLVFRGVAGPGAIGLVLGVVVLIDRWRAPLRNIDRAPAIGSERDFRDVAFQVDRLLERGDFTRAHTATVAICTWLKGERHYGSKRRQERLTTALENWTARRGEYDKRAEFIEQ